jgi:hypothetical protein
LALFSLALATMVPMLAIVSAGMWMLTLVGAWRATREAPFRAGTPWWCWPMVFGLHILQPLIRAWHRYLERMRRKLPRKPLAADIVRSRHFKRICLVEHSACWTSENGRGRESLLRHLENGVVQRAIPGVLDHAWEPCDISLYMNRWSNVSISTATEELGGPRRFTRVRFTTALTTAARTLAAAVLVWTVVALISGCVWGQWISVALVALLGMKFLGAIREANVMTASLVDRAAAAAGLHRYARKPRRLAASPKRTRPRQIVQSHDRPDALAGSIEVDAL